MTDPRNVVNHYGAGSLKLTYLIDDSTITASATAAGGSDQVTESLSTPTGALAVTLTATDDTISTVANNEFVLGALKSVSQDDKASVQVLGGVLLRGGTSATLGPGAPIVGDLLVAAEGYIQACPTASSTPTQDEVNAIRVARGWIQNDAASDAVKVFLN